MDIKLMQEFVSLESKKAELEAETKTVTKRIAELDGIIRDQMAECGIPKMTITVPGSSEQRTVFIRRDVYASPSNDRVEVVTALKACDLGYYLKKDYNANSLTAYVREIADSQEDRCLRSNEILTEQMVIDAMPPPLSDALKVGFKFTLKSRKGRE